jgi:hypothetical protein
MLVPAEDKLQHYYIGLPLALFLTIWFAPLIVVFMITSLAILWEFVRMWMYDYEIDFKDIFFGILPSLLIWLASFF